MAKLKKKERNKANKWEVWYNKITKHSAITIDDDGNWWKNVHITHNPPSKKIDRDKGKYEYKKMKVNPDLKDNRPSYYKNHIDKTLSSKKGKRYKNYRINDKDKAILEKIKD